MEKVTNGNTEEQNNVVEGVFENEAPIETSEEPVAEASEPVEKIAEEAEVKRIFHLTHNDADGLGCAIVASFHKMYVADTMFSPIGLAEQKLIEYLNTHDVPDFILITDLSVSEEVAVMLEEYCAHILEEQGKEVRLLLVDHHLTNTLPNKHSWAIVQEKDENGIPISAAKLLLQVIRGGIIPSMLPMLEVYIDKISRYDTWEWKRNPSEEMDEENTNILIKQLGIETAAQVIYESMSPKMIVLPEYCQHLINIYKQKRERFLPSVLEHILVTNYQEYTIALWVENGDYFNESLEYIYQTQPHVDIVWALCPSTRTFSFRTNRTDINLGRFAKMFGGGGHAQAAGAKVDTEVFLEWLEKYYNGLDYIRDSRSKAVEAENNVDFKEIESSIINIMEYCRVAKLKNDGLNYMELLNEHLISQVNSVINYGKDELIRKTFLLVRTLLIDNYEGYNAIRNDIDNSYGNLNALLNIFRMDDEKEPEPEPEVIAEEDVIPEPMESEPYVADVEYDEDVDDAAESAEDEAEEEIILDGNSEE